MLNALAVIFALMPLVMACLEPERGDGPSPSKDPRKTVEKDIEEPPPNENLPLTQEEQDFAKVIGVFKKPKYGPCTGCHAKDWPYLADVEPRASWKRYLESLTKPGARIQKKGELASVMVGCVDMATEDHCGGDPLDPTDNIDFKMPSKFGFDEIMGEDLEVLKRWRTTQAD